LRVDKWVNSIEIHWFIAVTLRAQKIVEWKISNMNSWWYWFTFAAGVWNICTLNSRISHYFRATLQLHNSPVDCARKLFKHSKHAANLLLCIKYFESFGFRFFVGDVMSGVEFRLFWLRLAGPGTQTLEAIFDSSFYWKLRYNPSLLSLWLAF